MYNKIRLFRLRRKEPYSLYYQILGFYPHDPGIYEQACLHRSSSVRTEKGHWINNERLEFLGDAVLDLVVGEYLFLRFPSWPEGELTRAKASAVCKPACAECAAKFQVGKYMRLGKGEELSGGRTRISILGDAFEAVIGAIYLDNNYEVAARFILGHLKKFLDLIDQGDYDHDYKSDLQELAQKHGDVDIRYDVVRDEGPDHDKTIWMKIMINGKDFGTGVGKNKKEAAQKAAKEAIERIHKGERF